jgi:hypothetical protein
VNEAEREQLAKRLSAMSLKDARKAIFRLDRDADLKYWRNSIWDEYHSLYVLPHAEVEIILVEKGDVTLTDKRDYTGPADRRQQDLDYQFVEARVKPLSRPVKQKRRRP